MTDYKSIKYNISGADLTGLTAGQIPNLDTAKITTGTLADARIASSNVTQHVTATDLTPVRQDILTLGLKQAVQENSTKFNLPNSAITKFEADADFNLAGSTDVSRVSADEYIATVASSSAPATTTTLYATAARSSAQSKFGGYSLDTTGNVGATNTSYLKSGDLTSITNTIGIGTWTVDFWFKYHTKDGTDRMFSFGNTANNTEPMLSMGYNTSGNMNFFANEGTNYNITFPTQDSNWHHYAIQKTSGGTAHHAWCDGVHKGNFVMSASNNLMSGHDLYIGRRHNNPNEYTGGWFDEFRVSNNTRYTNGSNFTPATSAYTYDANTVLLWHFDESTLIEAKSTTTANATGTALGTTNVPTSAVTDVSGVMLLKNAYGTNTLGTDVKVYFTADNSNWTEAASYADAGTFSTGIKMIKLGKTTCTSGSDVRWKAVWANQAASSKEAHIYGIGINY